MTALFACNLIGSSGQFVCLHLSLEASITRYIFANLIAFYSFSSVFFFKNVKLDFAMTLKEQKFAKISTREIRRSVIRKN